MNNIHNSDKLLTPSKIINMLVKQNIVNQKTIKQTETGIIKWYDKNISYGYIIQDNNLNELRVDIRALDLVEDNVLYENEKVQYQVKIVNDIYHAKNVKLLKKRKINNQINKWHFGIVKWYNETALFGYVTPHNDDFDEIKFKGTLLKDIPDNILFKDDEIQYRTQEIKNKTFIIEIKLVKRFLDNKLETKKLDQHNQFNKCYIKYPPGIPIYSK